MILPHMANVSHENRIPKVMQSDFFPFLLLPPYDVFPYNYSSLLFSFTGLCVLPVPS